jgi:hypothetical protein
VGEAEEEGCEKDEEPQGGRAGRRARTREGRRGGREVRVGGEKKYASIK